MSTDETRRDVAHLLRRAGFGARADDVEALVALGYEGAVDAVCDLATPDAAAEAVVPPVFDTAGYLAARNGDANAKRAAREQARNERLELIMWWLQRMVVGERPLREKLTLLWHDHFATSLQKVKLAELMAVQRQTMYELGAGGFEALAAAIVRDPAMLIWLDGRENTAGAPNENFAREFFELFTLGHRGGNGAHGDQPYTEQDVADAARAFTGWQLRRDTIGAALDARRHDTGMKTVLGETGAFGADDVVALAVAHPACAPHVVARLWSRLARPAGPGDPVVIELAAPFATDLDVAALLRRMFTHPAFRSPEARVGLVKTPIEFLVGAARSLRVPIAARHVRALVALGQVPFAPPDVAGWPSNEGWLSTSSALTRMQLAVDMAAVADVESIIAAPPKGRPSAVGRLLGVDRWGGATRVALASTADDPRALLTVALAAPEYVLA